MWWIDESLPVGPCGAHPVQKIVQVKMTDRRWSDTADKNSLGPPFRFSGDLFYRGEFFGKILDLEIIDQNVGPAIFQYTLEMEDTW